MELVNSMEGDPARRMEEDGIKTKLVYATGDT